MRGRYHHHHRHSQDLGAQQWLQSENPYTNSSVFDSTVFSEDGPNELDKANEKALIKCLERAGKLKENSQEQQKREIALNELHQMVREWVVDASIAKGHIFDADRAESELAVRGDIYAFGSYRLGVHSTGDDIDVLCVGPWYLTHDDFFDDLGSRLKKNSRVKNLRCVKEAFVPVMNFDYGDVDIDLVWAALRKADSVKGSSNQTSSNTGSSAASSAVSSSRVEDENGIGDGSNNQSLTQSKSSEVASAVDIFSDEILRKMEVKHIHAMNGTRIAKKILERVPNVESYKLALRAIRHWAKRRGVYGNKVGYPGGVAWAILTGKVCQMNPNHNAAQLFEKFFLLWHTWNFGSVFSAVSLNRPSWHDDMPAHIKNIAWIPQAAESHRDVMHVLTPAYPCINSTHNVSHSTFDTLKREWARAFHLTRQMQAEQRIFDWETLFSPSSFFMDYPYYLSFSACAPKEYSADFIGLVESKIRNFVGELENDDLAIVVRPHYKGVKVKINKKNLQLKTRAKRAQFLAQAKMNPELFDFQQHSMMDVDSSAEINQSSEDGSMIAVKNEKNEESDKNEEVSVTDDELKYDYIYSKHYSPHTKQRRPPPADRSIRAAYAYAVKKNKHWLRKHPELNRTDGDWSQFLDELDITNNNNSPNVIHQTPDVLADLDPTKKQQTDEEEEKMKAAVSEEQRARRQELINQAVIATELDKYHLSMISSAPMIICEDLTSTMCCEDWSYEKIYANRSMYDLTRFYIGLAFTDHSKSICKDYPTVMNSAALMNACAVFFDSLHAKHSTVYKGAHVSIELTPAELLPKFVFAKWMGLSYRPSDVQLSDHRLAVLRRDYEFRSKTFNASNRPAIKLESNASRTHTNHKRRLSDMNQTDQQSVKPVDSSKRVKMEGDSKNMNEVDMKHLESITMSTVQLFLKKSLSFKGWSDELNQDVSVKLKTALDASQNSRWNDQLRLILIPFGFNFEVMKFESPLSKAQLQKIATDTGSKFRKYKEQFASKS